MVLPLCRHIVYVVVQLLSWVWLFATPWIAAYQASLSFTISQSLLKLMSKAQTHEFAQSLLKLMSKFRGRGGGPRGLWAVLMPNSRGRQKETLSFIFLGLLRSFSSSQSLWSLSERVMSPFCSITCGQTVYLLCQKGHTVPVLQLPLLSLLLPPLPLPRPVLSSPPPWSNPYIAKAQMGISFRYPDMLCRGVLFCFWHRCLLVVN